MDISHPYWPWHNRKGERITMEEASALCSAEGNSLRTVGKAKLGPLLVSTVFLVVGHICHGGPSCKAPDDEPLGCMAALYETMIFHEDEDDGRLTEWDGRQWRYHTLREAIEGHARVIAEVAALVE
jgi:hypothetical protein